MRLVLDARTAAFAALVDYAGVFPPASLTVAQAVDGYRDALASDSAWVAGRILIRASQLEELGAVATATMVAGEGPWEVGVIFDLDPAQSADLSVAFHAEMEPAMTVAAAEARIIDPTIDGIERLFTIVGSVNPDVVAFLEVTRSANIEGQVTSIAKAIKRSSRVGGAKLRCGGVTSDLFPTVDEVAGFILATVNASTPFKATAGLHQPVRHFDAAIGVYRHGFLNILMASAAAREGAPHRTIIDVLSETDPSAFAITPAFATWRDLSIPGSALRRVRQTSFIAYGSCDFKEPVEALNNMEMLGVGT